MATLSFADLKDTAKPSLWDLDEIKTVELADGASFADMVADVNAGLALVNGEMLSAPHYGDMIAVQDEVELEYPIGVSNGVEVATEYGTPTPKRGATTGHSLPLIPYDRALGWTMMYVRKARRMKLDADVRSAVTDIRSHWQQKILERFFKMEGEAVGTTANASVPLADGGTVDSTYVPNDSPDGESFASSHDHFLRTATLNQAALDAAVESLQEHGHQGPFDIIAARADAGTWTNTSTFTGFKKPEWPGIVYHSSATERMAQTNIEEYFGYVEGPYGISRLWLTPRVPTNYFGVFKSYGAGDPRNPVRIRIDNNFGFGWQIVPGNWVNAPSLMAVCYAEMGFGIGEDRTNGVCTYIAASGDYVTPTIS